MRRFARMLAVAALALLPCGPAQSGTAPSPEPRCTGVAPSSVDELRRLGEVAWQRGDFAEAAACWLGEAGGRKGVDPAGEARALLRAGHALRSSGDFDGARTAFTLAARRARAANDADGELEALAGLGAVYLAEGDSGAAASSFDEALEAARGASRPALVAAIQNERGNLLSSTGRDAEALSAYRESESQARAAGNAALAMRAAANALRVEVRDPKAGARERIQSVAAEAGGLPDDEAKARLLIHLGRSAVELSDRQRADRAEIRRDAALLYTAAARTAAAARAERTRSFALGYLAELYEADGRLEEAGALAQRAIFAAQVADDPDALYRWHRQLGHLEWEQHRNGPALAWYRQSVKELSRLRTPDSGGRGLGAAAFLAAAGPVYDEFVDLVLVEASETQDDSQLQALLAEARGTLEDFKAAELRDYFDDECVDTQRRPVVESIPGALIVYPIVLPDRVELILGDQSGLRRVVSRVDRARFDARVHEFRRLLESSWTHAYRAAGEELYEWLIAPIEASLGDAPVETLVFVPGGSLRTIPMGALIDPRSGLFLIQKYAIAVAPGLTLTEPERIDRAQVALLSAGVSVARQGYPALPGVADEVAASQEAFQGVSLMNQEFVTTALEHELETTEFGIVHIASHGAFGSDIDDSYVLTYDGKLSVGELAEMVGTTRFRGQPVELLTLSACETAAGDERAALGMAGLALRSGARSALATLWRVNDEATAELVSEFHRQLAEPGSSRAGALQTAQLKTLGQLRYRHPAFWAPFLLIGSWL